MEVGTPGPPGHTLTLIITLTLPVTVTLPLTHTLTTRTRTLMYLTFKCFLRCLNDIRSCYKCTRTMRPTLKGFGKQHVRYGRAVRRPWSAGLSYMPTESWLRLLSMKGIIIGWLMERPTATLGVVMWTPSTALRIAPRIIVPITIIDM